ncbi:MAG TPA: phosphatase PAP2 family protein [Candidatus Saccharimonadales bacterium]|nr:phosphatase PAP2 family protein [Candidatus Saccharimonadales bacterium]
MRVTQQTIEKHTVAKPTFFQRISVVQDFLIILIGVFIVLAFLARNFPYFSFDLVITRSIQQITFPGFDVFMFTLTNLGNPVAAAISILLISFILLLIKRYSAVVVMLISSCGVSLIGLLVKELVARPRPNALLIHQIGIFVKNDSFPSGHVLHFIGLFGFLFIFLFTKFKKSFLRNSLLLILAILLIGIGISRIYIGAHWFSDVLGSYLIGTVWLYVMAVLYNKLEK